jgi:hypothetical protein
LVGSWFSERIAAVAEPQVTRITIGDIKFNATSASVGITTHTDGAGVPMMGTFQPHIEAVVDINDEQNMPHDKVKALFNLAKVVTQDKIKDIKIEFWKDNSAQDVICVYTFKGWISNFQLHSAAGTNHTLVLSLQPILDPQNVFAIDISN